MAAELAPSGNRTRDLTVLSEVLIYSHFLMPLRHLRRWPLQSIKVVCAVRNHESTREKSQD